MRNKELFKQKKEVAQLYGGVCFVCNRKFGKGFTFHHLWYNEGEKTYRDFKNPREYTIYILKVVKEHPKQFLLLCRKHHVSIEMLKRYKRETLERLLEAVRLSLVIENGYLLKV